MFHTPNFEGSFTPSTSTIADKKKYGSNIFSKTTFMPNFIKIGDSELGMFPCESETELIELWKEFFWGWWLICIPFY